MKKLLFSAVLLSLCAASAHADALFFAVKATPYDNQMSRIRPVLTSSDRDSGKTVSLQTVNLWMSQLRSIPYGYCPMWKTPAETQSGSPADCKAKAVALYEKMKANGASNVRLVIGKRTAFSSKTHAWLAWESQSGSYLLDPTFFYSARPAAKTGKRDYQPLYAFAGTKKFQAASGLVASN
jgi:predicted transglutaminase-like cysteine proteinase